MDGMAGGDRKDDNINGKEGKDGDDTAAMATAVIATAAMAMATMEAMVKMSSRMRIVLQADESA